MYDSIYILSHIYIKKALSPFEATERMFWEQQRIFTWH